MDLPECRIVFGVTFYMLHSHVFAGARHAVPLPGDPVSTDFMNIKLRFHRSLCPPEGMGVVNVLFSRETIA
jgi:hypothetical protein